MQKKQYLTIYFDSILTKAFYSIIKVQNTLHSIQLLNK